MAIRELISPDLTQPGYCQYWNDYFMSDFTLAYKKLQTSLPRAGFEPSTLLTAGTVPAQNQFINI